jgi:hypothetical protein
MPGPRLQWINPHQELRRFPAFVALAEPIRPAPVPSQEPASSGVEEHMNGIIYLVGLIVVIMFILSFLGLR